MAAKQLPSYYSAIKTLNVSDSSIFSVLIVDVRSCKNKHTIKNKDSQTTTANAATKTQNNSDPLISIALLESICNCKDKHVNKKSDDHN